MAPLPPVKLLPLPKPVAPPRMFKTPPIMAKPVGMLKGPAQFHVHIHLPALGGRPTRGSY